MKDISCYICKYLKRTGSSMFCTNDKAWSDNRFRPISDNKKTRVKYRPKFCPLAKGKE